MKVICHYRNDSDREINDPLPEKPWRFVFRLYSGDICSPMLRMFRKENWFSPPYPSKVWRKFVRWACRLDCLATPSAVMDYALATGSAIREIQP